ARAAARVPSRSPPAHAIPVTIHPAGSGHGHHTGMSLDRAVTDSTISALMCSATCSGGTGPHVLHRQSEDIRSGGRTGPPHRGQLTATPTLITFVRLGGGRQGNPETGPTDGSTRTS